MKKIIYVILLYCFLINNSTNIFASNNNFAQIISNKAMLYNSTKISNDYKNIRCNLQKTYFVKILNKYDNQLYYVEYNGIKGYVLKSDIVQVSGIPLESYPICEIVTIMNPCILRSTPEILNDNKICSIPSNQKLKYIGVINGGSVLDYSINIWYLVEYNGLIGYIYNKYVYSMDSIYDNTEKLTIINENYNENINPLSNSATLIIIILLTIPSISIIAIIFSQKTNKNIIQKKRKAEKEIEENY